MAGQLEPSLHLRFLSGEVTAAGENGNSEGLLGGVLGSSRGSLPALGAQDAGVTLLELPRRPEARLVEIGVRD